MYNSKVFNELPNLLATNSSDPVTLNNTPLNCLMYADDLVLLSTSPEGLQNCINTLEKFCIDWKLQINITKTKTLIFNKQGKINLLSPTKKLKM